MSSTELQAMAERIFASVASKEIDAVLACFADDAVFIDPHYPSPTMAGKAAIADGFRWVYANATQLGFTPVRYYESADGQHISIEVDTHHIFRMGMQVRFQQVFCIDVLDGHITRLQAYTPYGPPGIGGAILGVTRLQKRLFGKRARKNGK